MEPAISLTIRLGFWNFPNFTRISPFGPFLKKYLKVHRLAEHHAKILDCDLPQTATPPETIRMLYSKGTHFCSLLVFVKLALAADISLNRWPNKGAKELCCERSACTRAISNPHSLLFGPDAYASSLPALFDSTQYRVWEWCGFTDDFSRSKEKYTKVH